MTTFVDILGPQIGPLVEVYWPFLVLFGGLYFLFIQVGVMKLLSKAIKQVFVMATMAVLATTWWVLVCKHWQAVDVPAFVRG